MKLEDFVKNHQQKISLLQPEHKSIRKKVKQTDEWIAKVAKVSSEFNPKLVMTYDKFLTWIESQISKSLDPLHDLTHAKRVASMMHFIGKQEDLMDEVSLPALYATGMAHDLGRKDFLTSWKPLILLKSLRDEAHSIQKIKAFFDKDHDGIIPQHVQKAMSAIEGTAVLRLFRRFKEKKAREDALLTQLVSDADNLEMVSKARIAQALMQRRIDDIRKTFVDTTKDMCMKYLLPRLEESLHFGESKHMLDVMTFESIKFLEEVDPEQGRLLKKTCANNPLIS